MANRELRRHLRIPYSGPIRLSWEDASSGIHYTQATCIDISKSGLRVESPVAIPARATVSLHAERIKLSGAARVKTAVRRGSKWILGVELNQSLREEFLSKASEGLPREVEPFCETS
jgi:hypothetical protein